VEGPEEKEEFRARSFGCGKEHCRAGGVVLPLILRYLLSLFLSCVPPQMKEETISNLEAHNRMLHKLAPGQV
jgi:hypothetical protein